MSLWNSLRSAVLGVNLEEEQRRGDQLDAQLQQLNAQDYGPGGVIYNVIADREGAAKANETQELVEQHMAEGKTPDVEAEVSEAFQEGLEEGAANIRGAIAAPFKLTWKIIPWQVWLVVLVGGAIYLFVFMGGTALLRGLLPRRFK